MKKDTDDPGKFPGMKTTLMQEIEKIRREAGSKFDPDAKTIPDPLPFDKLQEMEENERIHVPKVASKKMSLAEVNALIMEFREGDKEAETALYRYYIRLIKMLMRKSPWYDELKDPEALSMHIWIKLAEWFQNNIIRKGPVMVVANRVRGMVRDQAVKDKREQPLTKVSKCDLDNKKRNLKRRYMSLDEYFKGHAGRDDFKGIEEEKDIEIDFGVAVAFRQILSKCLRRLTEQKQKIIDRFFFQRDSLREISKELGLRFKDTMSDRESAIKNLRSCFKSHEIKALGDLL